MRLRGALLWESDGEPHHVEVLISDERPTGAGSPIVILDDGGQERAASSDELPPGSVLLLPADASDRDVDLIQESGYAIRRVHSPSVGGEDRLGDEFDDDEYFDVSDADRAVRRAAIEAAEAELEEVTERLRREVRARHPDLFDTQGKLRPGAFARMMRERTDGRGSLTREEYIDLTGGPLAPPGDSPSTNAT